MPKKISIIEDELPIQSVFKELLIDAGYEVVTANDGVEEISAYYSGKFDRWLECVLCMGRVLGLAILKRFTGQMGGTAEASLEGKRVYNRCLYSHSIIFKRGWRYNVSEQTFEKRIAG